MVPSLTERSFCLKVAGMRSGESKKSSEGAEVLSSDVTSTEWSGLRVRAAELECALELLSLEDRLLSMRREVRGKIIFTTSFGLEDQVILHSLRQHQIDVDIVTLDTGRLFPETYALWAESEQRYAVRIRAVYPQHAAIEALVSAHGINGFYNSPEIRKACCHARKIEPLNRALTGAVAWVTGIRAEQSDSRRELGLVDIDWSRGILKFNPLFDWTRDAALNFAQERNVPVNALHAKGFVSIGCAPCTRAIGPDEPERAGRWWWERDGNKECGLHERPRDPAAPAGWNGHDKLS
jgi:phosphoadenosine phosphosulfate reductase